MTTTTTDVPPAASEDRWPALESEDRAFTALLHKLIRPAASPSSDATSPSSPYSFHDVFSLDENCLAFVPGETLALILAYDHSAIPAASTDEQQPTSTTTPNVVFIKQLPALDNACGTIALIHAALNALPSSGVPPSSILASLVPPGEEGAGSEEMGRRLDAHEAIHAAHWYVYFDGLLLTKETSGEKWRAWVVVLMCCFQ
jgi:ubiquitin carboxyl-terminal hydrolase L3